MGIIKPTLLTLIFVMSLPLWAAKKPPEVAPQPVVESSVEDETPCEVVVSESSNALNIANSVVGLPQVPVLGSTHEDREPYLQEIRSVLGLNSKTLQNGFYQASGDADKRFSAINKDLLGGSKSGQSMIEVFDDFNRIAAQIAPPEKFSPSSIVEGGRNMTALIQSGARALILKTGLGKKLPPTVEQWLAVYTAEAPRFEDMRENVVRAVEEGKSRMVRASVAISEMEELIKVSNELKAKYQEAKVENEALLATITDPAEREEWLQSVIIPIAKQIEAIDEYVNVHATILAQKRIIIAQSDIVLNEVQRTADLAIPGLRNSAITADDALFMQQLGTSAQKMRDILRRSLDTTTDILDNTQRVSTDLANTPVYSPEEVYKQVSRMVGIINSIHNQVEQQLPNIESRILEHQRLHDRLMNLDPLVEQIEMEPKPSLAIEDGTKK